MRRSRKRYKTHSYKRQRDARSIKLWEASTRRRRREGRRSKRLCHGCRKMRKELNWIFQSDYLSRETSGKTVPPFPRATMSCFGVLNFLPISSLFLFFYAMNPEILPRVVLRKSRVAYTLDGVFSVLCDAYRGGSLATFAVGWYRTNFNFFRHWINWCNRKKGRL